MNFQEIQPLVSVIIVSWNTYSLLAECVDSVLDTLDFSRIEIIIVDNGSTDGSIEMIELQYPFVHLLTNSDNVGFARANNQAAAIARGKYLLLLNSDAALLPGALVTLVDLAESNPQLAAAGPRLIYPDGRFQFSYADFPNIWREFLILSTLGRKMYGDCYPSHRPDEKGEPRVVDYIHGACMLILRDIYLGLGGLPEQYFMYAEEVDFCHHLRQMDYQVWHHPNALVLHHGGASSQSRLVEREGDMYQSRVRLMRKYHGNLAAGLLKAMILFLTTPKLIWHGFFRHVSHGRHGRPVISLHQLISKLREV